MADYRNAQDQDNAKNFGFGQTLDQANSLADFLKQKNQFQQQMDLKNKAQLGDFLEKGIKPDASGLNAFGQSNQDTTMATNQHTADTVNPNSTLSKAGATFIGKAPSAMGAPTGVPLADQEKLQPVVDSAVKAKSAVDVYGKKLGVTMTKDLQKDQQSLITDPSYKQAQKGLDDGAMAKGQLSLASTNPIASGAMPIVMAKLKTGTSRLNIAEINAFGGSKAIEARIGQALEQAKSGKLTPENTQFLGTIIDKDDEVHRQTLHQATLKRAMQRSMRTHKPINESYKELSGEDLDQPAVNNGQGAQPPQMGVGFDPDAYLKGTPGK